MRDLYVGYTLGDIVSLAHERTVTYLECAEILEQELQRRFPWIKPEEFYPLLWKKSSNYENYCYQLIKAGKQLEEISRN